MLAATLLLLALSAHAADHGWRGDGTGVSEGAPDTWAPAWTRPLARWSNASPVRFGGLACAQAEPTTLLCVDAATGALAWEAAHPVVDALDGADWLRAQALVAELEVAARELPALEVAVTDLRRLQHVHPDAEGVHRALELAVTRRDAVSTRLEGARHLRTPDDLDVVGYTTSTPTTDGERLYALFGNGVVVARGVDGRVRWQRWLGRPVTPMRGYDRGHAASLALADGLLLVPWGELHALDPATGRTVWTDGRPWRDYGSPAVTTVDGLTVVFTPDGRMLRARDGAPLQDGLGDLVVASPYAIGPRVFYVGGPWGEHDRAPSARAWSLRRDGEAARAEALWATPLGGREALVAGPVLTDGLLFTVDKAGTLRVLDADTGAIAHTMDLQDRLRGWVYASPWVAGGTLWVTSTRGRTLQLTAERAPAEVGVVELGPLRATPLFAVDAVYVRTLDGLTRYGP